MIRGRSPFWEKGEGCDGAVPSALRAPVRVCTGTKAGMSGNQAGRLPGRRLGSRSHATHRRRWRPRDILGLWSPETPVPTCNNRQALKRRDGGPEHWVGGPPPQGGPRLSPESPRDQGVKRTKPKLPNKASSNKKHTVGLADATARKATFSERTLPSDAGRGHLGLVTGETATASGDSPCERYRCTRSGPHQVVSAETLPSLTGDSWAGWSPATCADLQATEEDSSQGPRSQLVWEEAAGAKPTAGVTAANRKYLDGALYPREKGRLHTT